MKTLKKALVVLTLILTTLTCFSQQTEINKQNKWKIGMTFSPDVYLNPITVAIGENTGHHIGSEGFNYTHGLTLELMVSPKIGMGTGIVASKKDYSEKYYCNNCDFMVNSGDESITQRFIEIPLLVRYNIIDKRFGLHIETGVTNSFLTTERNKTGYKGKLITNKFLMS
ncbi:MAG: outer membrane beta-barrel protein [Bacteroidia bacterium]